MLRLIHLRDGWAWIILIVATCLSWESVNGFSGLSGAGIAAAVVLGVAFFKVFIIMMEFMELRDAPLWLRFSLIAWTASVAGILITIFVS